MSYVAVKILNYIIHEVLLCEILAVYEVIVTYFIGVLEIIPNVSSKSVSYHIHVGNVRFNKDLYW